MKILLVEDDAAARAMLALTLRQAGLEVTAAPGGADALRLLQERHYDLLITDAQMAPMDGFSLAKRAHVLDPSLRILMVSAVCTNADCSDAPIERCFSKPVAADELLHWVERPRPPREGRA
jgi:DNA-binding response OmpR family regulator